MRILFTFLATILSVSVFGAANDNRVGTFTPFTRSLNSNSTAATFLSSLGISTNVSGTNAIYIAYRTDGLPGDGSAGNPLDGSTYTKLNNILSNTVANQTIYFYPSLLYSVTVKHTNGVVPYYVKSGQSLIGIGGKDAVKISAATNSAVNADSGKSAVFVSSSDVSNVVIRGIWVCGNGEYFIGNQASLPGSTLSNAMGAIALYGQNNLVEDCKISGTYGVDSTSSEDFPIYLSGPSSVGAVTNEATILTRQLKGNTIRGCEHIWTNLSGANWAYGGQCIAQSISYGGSDAENLYNRTKHLLTYNIIENCIFTAATNTQVTGAFCGASALVEVRNNRMYYGGIAYSDTWGTFGFRASGNHVILGPNNIGVDIVLATNDAAHYERTVDLEFRNNTFYRLTNSGTGGGSEAIFRIYGNTVTNPSTGNWMGGQDILVEGNTFIGNTNRTIYGIFGNMRNLKIHNNLFKHIGIGFYPQQYSSQISIEGNTVEDTDIFLISAWASTPLATPGISDITVKNNIFKSLRRSAFLGGANNILFEGNIFRDYGLAYTEIGAGYNSKAIWMYTNGGLVGSDLGWPSLMTNVYIKNNIFMHITNDTYTADVQHVKNFIYTDNTDIGSGLVFGQGVNSTNFQGPRIYGKSVAWSATNATVGGAGGASALPANPLGYLNVAHPTDGRTNVLIPYYIRE